VNEVVDEEHEVLEADKDCETEFCWSSRLWWWWRWVVAVLLNKVLEVLFEEIGWVIEERNWIDGNPPSNLLVQWRAKWRRKPEVNPRDSEVLSLKRKKKNLKPKNVWWKLKINPKIAEFEENLMIWNWR
jgi:hypothetical protein